MLGCLVPLTPMIFAGCPVNNPASTGTESNTIAHWSFTMGNRGGGIISFNAVSPESGEKSGSCLVPTCLTMFEDLTVVRLAPLANDGYTFNRWEADAANALPCDVTKRETTGTIEVEVSRNGGCIAVFGNGTTTTPGVRRR